MRDNENNNWVAIVVVGVLVVMYLRGDLPRPVNSDPAKPITTEVTQVTYVYEKDNTAVPVGVSAALVEINAGDIEAAAFEKDTVTGNGTTPAQFKIALEAAKANVLPCLVVQAGNAVVRAVSTPTTKEEVMEAIK